MGVPAGLRCGGASPATTPLRRSCGAGARRQPASARRGGAQSRAGLVVFASDVSEWNAAAHMLDKYAKPGAVVGLGSGPITNKFVKLLGQHLTDGSISNIRLLPSNVLTAQEAAFHGVPIAMLSPEVKIDVMIDEVDELVDGPGLPLLKFRPRGDVQPDVLQELDIIGQAKEYVAVVDEGNVVDCLGNDIPVLIDEEGWEDIADELDDVWLGDAEIWRRPLRASLKVNPFGGETPHMTDGGHTLLDIRFQPGGLPDAPADAARMIEEVPGVIAHGLFTGRASQVIVATEAGVETKAR